jgi:amino-acid N-acetyltransferase
LEVRDWGVEIRRAHIADVPGTLALVERFAGRGEILPRSIADMYQTLREWVVAEQAGEIVGCGSLVILWADLAEIRSLVVAPEVQGMGIGRQLVAALLAQAAELEIPQVFALTRKTGFFHKLGFEVAAREGLPRKIWKDCRHCIKFVGCDEVAVARRVNCSNARFQDRPLHTQKRTVDVFTHTAQANGTAHSGLPRELGGHAVDSR